jgi:hypothetical protein
MMILNCSFQIAILFALGANPSPTKILDAAQQSLSDRQNVQLDFQTAQRSIKPDGSFSDRVRHISGDVLFSGGRYRYASERYDDENGQIKSNSYVRSTRVYDQERSESLRELEQSSRGFIDHDSNGFSMHDGIWLVTGYMYGVAEMRPDVERASLYKDLLDHAEPGTLSAETVTDDNGNEVVHVKGNLPWGEYQIWVDPQRDYNMTKFIADLHPVPIYNAARIRYESKSIELKEVNGKWMPVGATLETISEFGADSPNPVNAVEKTVTHLSDIKFDNIQFVSADEPADLFDIKWPKGILIRDRISDTKYVVGEVSDHELDQTVSNILKDVRDKKVNPQEETTTNEPEIVETGEEDQGVKRTAPVAAHSSSSRKTWLWFGGIGLVFLVIIIIAVKSRE